MKTHCVENVDFVEHDSKTDPQIRSTNGNKCARSRAWLDIVRMGIVEVSGVHGAAYCLLPFCALYRVHTTWQSGNRYSRNVYPANVLVSLYTHIHTHRGSSPPTTTTTGIFRLSAVLTLRVAVHSSR